jgi:hypothetical protein
MKTHRRLIGREAYVTRTWLSVIAVGALVAACAQPNPPVPSPTATVVPPVDTGSPPQSSPPGIPPGPMTDNMPPSALDANPPGTPSYVIAPGDPTGRRNSQIPQPGGRPAF